MCTAGVCFSLVPRPSSKEERRVQTPLSSCSVEGESGDETMFASAMVACRSAPCLYDVVTSPSHLRSTRPLLVHVDDGEIQPFEEIQPEFRFESWRRFFFFFFFSVCHKSTSILGGIFSSTKLKLSDDLGIFVVVVVRKFVGCSQSLTP